ncbi:MULTISPECIES: methyltransferase domain-containing protein [unclassified Sutcliffiella]|jgi:ubiquinone/menaquinone biosynthesis C-methylase UbiE|uniref:class I SAM-dependent methyltransferase n=1 Tax=unclassified Sutcliffiella TaxID=2837532 RepID=UPI0030CAE545
MEQNVFEQMAKKYDTEERIKLANIISKEVKTELRDSQSKSLIDYGSGTGLVSLALADSVESVLLVDSSKQMLEVAAAKIKNKGITNARVRYSDFTKESSDLKADILLLSLVLLHIPDTKQLLKELYNSLHPGEKLILVDFDKNERVQHPSVHNGFSQEELKQLLSETGFTSITMKTFYHGKGIFMKQDASMFISTSVKKK